MSKQINYQYYHWGPYLYKASLKKEVETGKHGTQKYVLKQGPNKGKTV